MAYPSVFERFGSASRALLPAILLLLLAPLFTCAQEVDDEGTLRIESNLVRLNVGVVDHQGHAILNLSRNNFAIYEEGIKQQIQSFEPVDMPFSLVMLLDMSGSTINFRQNMKTAAFRFLDALKPDDRVEVIAFSEKTKILAKFGTNREKTYYAIENADDRGGTQFFKALMLALNELRSERSARKAIVVMTDGVDSELRKIDHSQAAKATSDDEAIRSIDPNASSELNGVLRAADKQGVTIYPLALPSGDPKNLPLPDPQLVAVYASARSRLQTLADRSGGQFIAINRLDEMARIYPRVAADLRTLYTISYQSKGNEKKGWRSVQIQVDQPDLIARTKNGYDAR